MKVIDLCSGLGGASEAFLMRGHDVIRIDNNPDFKDLPNTIIADIRDIEKLGLPQDIDFLWMSPPCNNFSMAAVYRHWEKRTKRPKHSGVIDSIRLIGWCLDAVDYLRPRYWILENPRGMLRQILNAPGKAIPGVTTWLACWGTPYLKPTDLWGNLPPMDWPEKPIQYDKAPGGSNKGVATTNIKYFTKKTDFCNVHPRHPPKGAGCGKGGRDLRPSGAYLRAKIPYKLSQALCIAIEKQIGGGHNKVAMSG